MDVDQVHDMMDEIADQQEVAREISDAISNPTAFSSEFDDDDLEAELEALELEAQTDEQAHLEKQLLDVTPISSLPEVPKTDLPKSKTKPKKVKEEDEMAELAAWAS